MFYLKCDLKLNWNCCAMFSSLFFLLAWPTHRMCVVISSQFIISLWEATKTHAGTKKQKNKKNNPLHSCWTWAETHNITSVIEFNDAFFLFTAENLLCLNCYCPNTRSCDGQTNHARSTTSWHATNAKSRKQMRTPIWPEACSHKKKNNNMSKSSVLRR